ncbi:MAG: hypothetical protein GC138_07865 [Gammaproteobacteria bacterium]|nr:hypothetical protein [Gammaproteobacteria bacterium]
MLNLSHVMQKPGRLAIAPSDDGLAIADLKPGKTHPSLTLCEFTPWKSTDNRETVVAARSASLHLKNRACATVLETSDYNILNMEAPNVPDEEVNDAIRWQIRDLIDFDVEDAVIEVFPAPPGNGIQQKRLLHVVVTRAQTLKTRADLIYSAKTKLDVVDIPELALRNIATRLQEDSTGVALVHLTAERGMVLISRKGQLYFARTMNTGIRGFKETSQTSGDLALADTSPFDRLILEIQRSLDYYDRYFSQPPIAGIVFTPLAEPVPGLFDFVKKSLGVNVRELDMAEVVEFGDNVSPTGVAQCVVAIGAAMRDFQ